MTAPTPEHPPLDVAELRRLVADKIALSRVAFDGSDKPRFVAFGFSDAEDILAALETLEKQLGQYKAWLKYDIEGLGTPEEARAALERAERVETAAVGLLGREWLDDVLAAAPAPPPSLEETAQAIVENYGGAIGRMDAPDEEER